MHPLTEATTGRVVLHEVPWSTYEVLLAGLGDRAGVRVSYDRGELEIVSPSRVDERLSRLLGRLVQTLTLELGLPCLSVGSATIRRQDLLKGVEPDESYYLAHEPAVRDRDELDFAIDPPPDLIVEVDLSSDSRARKLGIYAALRVPEVWRVDARSLEFLLLDEAGAYRSSSSSRAFPQLESGDLERFLLTRGRGETELLLEFRTWIQEHFRGE